MSGLDLAPQTWRITKCKRKDAFLRKVGSFLKENDAKGKKGGRMLFFLFHER